MLGGSEKDTSGLYRRTTPSASARWSESLPALMAAVAVRETEALTASAIAEELVATMGACCAAVHFADEDENVLRLVASCNMAHAPAEVRVHDGSTREPAASAARSRLLFLSSDPAHREGTCFAIPLLCGARLLGVVTCELPVRVEPRELASLDAAGVVLGALLDRARREEEASARAEWTSLVAHELRQPLNAMSMHASVLRGESEDAAGARSAQRISENVQRLRRLVGDLTDASLIDLDRVLLTRRPTDLVELTTELTDVCGHPAGSIRVEARGELPVVDVDRYRVQQVLSNLLDNARKHARESSVIRIILERRGGEVVISVTNDGPTIDESRRARLFDRYYRGDAESTDGLGIGLYVCRALAAAHGGTLSVVSHDGTTTFSLALPLGKEQTTGSSAPPRPVTAPPI
jgi:signal transduction histidine kinase